jgi:shikimate dehydrogenase
MGITGHTAVYGILGWPVEHTASPPMQNAAFAAAGVDAVYVPFAVAPQGLEEAVRGLRALGVRGFNVTLPHKEAIVSLLDAVDADAQALGAVNTVVREGAALVGLNTDGPGLARSLHEAGVALEGARVTVLGAGGAARAAVVGLSRAGATVVRVAARRVEQARQLVEQTRALLPGTSVSACTLDGELEDAFAHTDVLVQATSATLGATAAAEALAASLPFDALPGQAVVVDLVYDPRETTVLRAAAARGLRTVGGLGMLLHQGALAFERWTGQEAPLGVMREALERAV